MAAPGSDSIILGLASAAGSMLLGLLGVEPATVFVTCGACFLGSPFAAPSGNKFRAVAVYASSVVVTCHSAALVATGVSLWFAELAPYERRVQAAAAVCIGVGLHIVVSHLPTIVRALGTWIAKRLGVQA